MSAFLCSDKHLTILANAINHYIYKSDNKDGKAIFKKLKQLNIESINYRYQENSSTNVDGSDYINLCYDYYSFHQLIKAAQCYIYQSCEVPNYRKRWAIKISYRLINTLSLLIVENHKMYVNADWIID